MDSFQYETTRVISALEVVPVVLAAQHWKERARHPRTFYFVDNDAARAGLIKLQSDVPTIRRALLQLVGTLEACPSFPWFSRVPSASNLGDSASRLEELALFANVATEVFPKDGRMFVKRDWECLQAGFRKRKKEQKKPGQRKRKKEDARTM